MLVPSFTGETEFEIQVPCTYDHEVAATKYFGGLGDGASRCSSTSTGRVFYRSADGRLQMMLLPWDLSVRYELPVATWRGMIDRHYPRAAGSGCGTRRSTDSRRRSWERGSATFDATVDGAARRATEADGDA